MQIELQTYQFVMILVAGFGGLWTLGAVMFRLFTQRLDEQFKHADMTRKSQFETLRQTLDKQQSEVSRLDRDLMALRAELPEKYLRREDYVRGQTLIEAKLDSIAGKLEMVMLKNVERRHDD